MRKAIFWDFDGTLTRSYPMWTQTVLEAAAPFAQEYGITFEKLRPFLAKGFPWHSDGDPTVTGDAWWEDRVRKFTAAYRSFGVPETLGEQAARTVRERILDPRKYQVYPDASAVLALCAYKGYKNYLLSDNFPELEELLEKLYLRPFFTGCLVSGKVGLNKPDVRLFRKAELMAHFPSLIWMVGDNPAADLKGAKGAGWHGALVHWGQGKNAQADLCCDTLTELLHHL